MALFARCRLCQPAVLFEPKQAEEGGMRCLFCKKGAHLDVFPCDKSGPYKLRCDHCPFSYDNPVHNVISAHDAWAKDKNGKPAVACNFCYLDMPRPQGNMEWSIYSRR